MRQISKEMAIYLFNGNREVFKLYPDGTEGVVESCEEIAETDLILGVEE